MKVSDVVNADKPCGGKGICGKCKVYVKGEVSPLSDTEKKLLSAEEIQNGIRLACCTEITGKVQIDLTGGNLQIDTDINAVPCLAGEHGFGVAIDIGTTSVCAYLYSYKEGKIADKKAFKNPQSVFGADIITRIEFAQNGGLSKLRQAILSEIKGIFGINPIKTVVTGNTAMMHIFAGLSPVSLANAPFTVQSHFGEITDGYYIPRCISSFIGADTLCAVLASNMKDNSILVDIGTNAEMVIRRGETYICCSAAAGPAFEGVGIKMGMTACDGALQRVYKSEGKIKYETIGNAKPIGICGSGLVDAVALMADTGYMDKTGRTDKDFYIGDSGVFLTQNDIRAFQLAKAAVRTGIEILKTYGNSPDTLYIAGGFGNRLDKQNCEKTGLIPENMNVCLLGNAAASGAVMMLQSNEYIKKADTIADNMSCLSLSEHEKFEEMYFKYMNF